MLWISKLIKTTLNLFTFKKGIGQKEILWKILGKSFEERRKDCRSGGTMTTCRVSLQTFPLNSCPACHLSRYSSFTFLPVSCFSFLPFTTLDPLLYPFTFAFSLFSLLLSTYAQQNIRKKTKYDEVKCNLFRSTITNLKSSLIWKKYSKYSTIGRAGFFKSQKLTLRDLSQWAVARLSKPQQISIVSRSADQLMNLSADDQLLSSQLTLSQLSWWVQRSRC